MGSLELPASRRRTDGLDEVFASRDATTQPDAPAKTMSDFRM
jgi:hypothetical protein